MTRGNHLDSIMRRVRLTDVNSNGVPFDHRELEFQDGARRSSVPGPSNCVVEEIGEGIGRSISEEHGAKVAERHRGDTVATPDVNEARELTLPASRESLASSAVFETEVERGEGERVEYSDGSVYEGDVVVMDGKVVRHGQVGARSASSAFARA